jgi:hypothetical protein
MYIYIYISFNVAIQIIQSNTSLIYHYLQHIHTWTVNDFSQCLICDCVFQKTPWPESRPLLVGEVSTSFCGYRCHVVSVTYPYGRILGFLGRCVSFKLRRISNVFHYPPKLLVQQCTSSLDSCNAFAGSDHALV